ncbi:hypothetical protein GCM10007416_02520 [Kroppenstedtia guangzhouensis]|uniref:Uncharacterized protein n=1 Tax=Kroppenstedtia guangzhouensis TaxID=1274356 RepID=A0ABQ1FZB4_9BACL|nr:hypothetical protein [Kroppenstedtia guangzhouensis]GGA33311.1 hypothetical protein GCM10007416_02520 [Kroppenstedtia guangzhouensis]
MKRRPIRASLSRVQEAKRWAWLKTKMEQLAERLPPRPPQQPFFPPPRDPEPRGFANPGPRGRGGGFDDLGWDAPFGLPPRPEGGASRRPEERSPRDGRDFRQDEWWGGPMMGWGRPQDREVPPWTESPRNRSREGEIPSWNQAPRYRDGDREREVPSWSGLPQDREEDTPYWGHSPRDRIREGEEAPSMGRSLRYREGDREGPADRRLEGGQRRGERSRRRSSGRDWEELPSLFDETEHVTSSGVRRRRSRSFQKRKY